MASLDDGYQGPRTTPALTEREADEIAGVIDAITQAEAAAQNAEDNEQLTKASKHRARARDLKAKLDALVNVK